MKPNGLDAYDIFTSNASDLRSCSKDDSEGTTKAVYMFDDDSFKAIDFDGVARAISAGTGMLCRSADALYEKDGNILSLIEFKNGRLRGHVSSPTSKASRREFAHDLKRAVSSVLEAHILELPAYAELENSLLTTIDTCVSSSYGKLKPKQQATKSGHVSGDNFTLETVKTKALCSALLLQRILCVPESYIRSKVDFVLVYNPELNPEDGSGTEIVNDQTVPRVASIESALPGYIAHAARRPLRRFGLADTIGLFFHNVITCTSEELVEWYL